MNSTGTKLFVVLVVTIAVLLWLKSDGRYDFDIRSIIPFMRGEVTAHDWGALAIIGLGCWGLSRLRRGRDDAAETAGDNDDSYEDDEASNDEEGETEEG